MKDVVLEIRNPTPNDPVYRVFLWTGSLDFIRTGVSIGSGATRDIAKADALASFGILSDSLKSF